MNHKSCNFLIVKFGDADFIPPLQEAVQYITDNYDPRLLTEEFLRMAILKLAAAFTQSREILAWKILEPRDHTEYISSKLKVFLVDKIPTDPEMWNESGVIYNINLKTVTSYY